MIERYFLSDILGIQSIVASKDIDAFVKVLKLLEDMVWMANNFIVHSPDSETRSRYLPNQAELAKKEGIDQLYIKLIQVYTEFHQQFNTGELLTTGLWQTFTWGLNTVSLALKNHDELYDEMLAKKQGKTEEEASAIDDEFKFYFFPYLTFLGTYMGKAIEANKKQFHADT